MGMIVAYLIITWSIVLFTVLISENHCEKHPESKYTKWWRKHFIKHMDKKDGDDDHWICL